MPGMTFRPASSSASPRQSAVAALLVGLLALLTVSACASRNGADGKQEVRFAPASLGKSDIDRVIDAHRRELTMSLKRLAEKLYRRNPREWRQVGQPSLEDAVARIFEPEKAHAELDQAAGEAKELREIAAARAAFREDFHGDRVLALISGLADMIDAAFEHKTEFYVLDELEAQKLANCARNIEIALWKLNSSRDAKGQPMLLASDGDSAGNARNLSFEREFGRMIGQLDLLSQVVADKNGRTVTRVVQNLATALFLPVKELLVTK